MTPEWAPSNSASALPRHLAKAYAMVVGDSVRVQNRIQSLLRSRGVPASGRDVNAVRSREDWLMRLREAARPQAKLLYREHDALMVRDVDLPVVAVVLGNAEPLGH